MKYPLKRSSRNLIIALLGAAALVGILIAFGEIYFPGVLFALVFLGFAVYEIIRIRGDKFFFDEESFSIGEQKYSFSQIDYLNVYAVSSRYSHTENIDIYINDEYIFGFNRRYENSEKFLDFAQNHGVKIKVGLDNDII